MSPLKIPPHAERCNAMTQSQATACVTGQQGMLATMQWGPAVRVLVHESRADTPLTEAHAC